MIKKIKKRFCICFDIFILFFLFIGHPSPSGLGLERFDSQYYGLDDRYILRPETAESIYYLHHFTGDEQWRGRSFAIAQRLNDYARRVNFIFL